MANFYSEHAFACERCDRKTSRTQVVYGYGCYERPPIAFVTESPSTLDDASGFPLSGPEGAVFDSMLKALGYTREDVFTVPCAMCRGSADPEPCFSMVLTQLRVVEPAVVVALGTEPANFLLKKLTGEKTLAFHRKVSYVLDGKPLQVTYSMSYLVRQPSAKRATWEDLQLAVARSRSGNPSPEPV